MNGTNTNNPSRVDDIERYWIEPPPELSERCQYWIQRFNNGFNPNIRIREMSYYSAAIYYGVYIWEYIHIIYPLYPDMSLSQRKG